MRSEEGLECCLWSRVQQPAQPCVAVVRGPWDEQGGMAHTGVHKQQARQVVLKILVSGPCVAHLILIFFLISVLTDSLCVLAGIDLPVCCMPSEHWGWSHSTISGLPLSTGPSVP